MKLSILAATAALLTTTTAYAKTNYISADYDLPKRFHGQWCKEDVNRLVPCTAGGWQFEAEGFGKGNIFCQLKYAWPVKNSRRDIEYQAMFMCMGGNEAHKVWSAFYWIGFDKPGEQIMFVKEANHGGFTAPKDYNLPPETSCATIADCLEGGKGPVPFPRAPL